MGTRCRPKQVQHRAPVRANGVDLSTAAELGIRAPSAERPKAKARKRHPFWFAVRSRAFSFPPVAQFVAMRFPVRYPAASLAEVEALQETTAAEVKGGRWPSADGGGILCAPTGTVKANGLVTVLLEGRSYGSLRLRSSSQIVRALGSRKTNRASTS